MLYDGSLLFLEHDQVRVRDQLRRTLEHAAWFLEY